MKKTIWKYLMMLAVVLGTSFAFTACSSDEDGNGGDKDLVGTWVMTETDVYEDWKFTLKVELTIKADGTGVAKVTETETYEGETTTDTETNKFTWSTKGNKIYLEIEDGLVEAEYKIRDKKLYLTFTEEDEEDGETYTYTEVYTRK